MLAANVLLIAAHANAVDAAVVTADADFKQAGNFVPGADLALGSTGLASCAAQRD
jgi:predicted nucleic acid-binding protein